MEPEDKDDMIVVAISALIVIVAWFVLIWFVASALSSVMA